jgi:hypothetical protein
MPKLKRKLQERPAMVRPAKKPQPAKEDQENRTIPSISHREVDAELDTAGRGAEALRPGEIPKDDIPSPGQPSNSLPLPDELLATLKPKYDVLTASIISSTKIQARVTRSLHQLRDGKLQNETRIPGVVLLHARQPEVCKMITVAETVKRTLEKEDKRWYQYNQLYVVAPRAQTKEKDTIEETISGNPEDQAGDDDDDDDDFETMESRFKRAILPQRPDRLPRSLRIFISTVHLPELVAKGAFTLQTNDSDLGAA